MGEGWGRMLFVLVFVLLFLFAVALFAGCGPVSVLVVLLVLLALLTLVSLQRRCDVGSSAQHELHSCSVRRKAAE